MNMNHRRRGSPLHVNHNGAHYPPSLPHFRNATLPTTNLLHVLLPGLKSSSIKQASGASDARWEDTSQMAPSDRDALLLSIIRGERAADRSGGEATRQAREVLLSIIRRMSSREGNHEPTSNEHSDNQQPHLLNSLMCKSGVARSSGFPSLTSTPAPPSSGSLVRDYGVSAAVAESYYNLFGAEESPRYAATFQCPVLPPSSDVFAPRQADTKVETMVGRDDEQLSDATTSTTARDNGSISLDTISSSETNSRPRRTTAFAVPLFMQSPDPLTVPIPVFASAAI